MKKSKQSKKNGQNFAWSFVIVCFLLSGAVLLNMVSAERKQVVENNNQAIDDGLNKELDKKTIQMIDDGCYEEYFVYSVELGICEIRGTNLAKCSDTPLLEKLKTCEAKNNLINLNVNATDFCAKKAEKIDPSAYQYNELFNNIKNNCLMNFAIAQKNSSLCSGISYDSTKEICIDFVNKFINR